MTRPVAQAYDHPQAQRYRNMIYRCHMDHHPQYPDYGMRGITVHWDWLFDFQAFADYLANVLGPCPAGYSLDRIDNDAGYEPGNLRWADRHTQVNNQRPKRKSMKPRKPHVRTAPLKPKKIVVRVKKKRINTKDRKLTPEQVNIIRTSGRSQASLAREFGVRVRIIANCLHRRSYSELP